MSKRKQKCYVQLGQTGFWSLKKKRKKKTKNKKKTNKQQQLIDEKTQINSKTNAQKNEGVRVPHIYENHSKY